MSEDDTPNVIQSFSDNRVIYIKKKSDKESPNSKYAFEICMTKYLVIFHDDDLIDAGYLDRVINEMEANDYSAVGVLADIIDENGSVTQKCSADGGKAIYSGHLYIDSFIQNLGSFPSMGYPTAMYRKDFYGNRDGFTDPKVGPAQDQYIWFQTERKGGKICVVKEKYYEYRKYANQVSSQMAGEMEVKLFKFLSEDEYYCEILERNRKYLAKLYFKFFRILIYRFHERKIARKKLSEVLDMIPVDPVTSCIRGKLLKTAIKFTLKAPKIMSAILVTIRNIKHPEYFRKKSKISHG